MGNSKSSPAPTAVTPVVPPAPAPETSSSVATPPPPLSVPSPSYVQEQPKPQTQTQPPPAETSQNPGTFEEFHKKCKGMRYWDYCILINDAMLKTSVRHIVKVHCYQNGKIISDIRIECTKIWFFFSKYASSLCYAVPISIPIWCMTCKIKGCVTILISGLGIKGWNLHNFDNLIISCIFA